MPRNNDEKTLQNKVKKYFEKNGCLVYKTMGGVAKMVNGFYSASSGWPDLIVFCKKNMYFIGSRTIFIECKSKIGKLRPTQIVKIKELQDLNYTTYIARPNDNIIDFFEMENCFITQEEYEKALEQIRIQKEKKKWKN